MADSFDALDFAWYLHRNWRKVALCCASAFALTLAGSLVAAKRYTATATVVIQSPGGSDPRTTTAVSPVYLESLRTFELMASSDSLFLDSMTRLHLRERYAGKSIESLKRSVLEITKPVNTRLILISATLNDPNAAQALAQDIAEKTVALSRTVSERSGAEPVRDAQGVFDKATARLTAAQAAMDSYIAKLADGSATSQLESAADLRLQASRDLNTNEAELAGLLAKQAAEGAAAPAWLGAEIGSLRARISTLGKQQDLLAGILNETGKRTERLAALHSELEAELKSARLGFDAARTRLDEAKAQLSSRGEWLEVLDPGIIPQRPSAPNVVLNLLISLGVSLLTSFLWLALRFGLERAAIAQARRDLQLR